MLEIVIDEQNTSYLRYNIEAIVSMLMQDIEKQYSKQDKPSSLEYIYIQKKDLEDITKLVVEVRVKDYHNKTSIDVEKDKLDIKKYCKKWVTAQLYKMLSELTNKKLDFGILTGIRPVRVYIQELEKGKTLEEVDKYFLDELFVSSQKLERIKQTYQNQKDILKLSSDDTFSLYISIPFCPTRCSYCSFISQDIKGALKLVEPYVERLTQEIIDVSQVVKKRNLKLLSIYIGGGTPTTLNETQLDKIIKTVKENFDLSYLVEFTVEAGRPDTITVEKLQVLKENGVDRISINPQTFNQNVLDNIGRKHTVSELIQSYELAKEIGFESINMDLIAALPEDSLESFCHSIDRVIELDVDNVTIHSLSKKRGSRLDTEEKETESGSDAKKMLDYAHKQLTKYGYSPYYMYKQKNTVDSLENIGYCKKNKQSIYNIFIMDECHSIIGVGAGASSKMVRMSDSLIKRVYNPKYSFEYLAMGEIDYEKKFDI